MDDTHPAHRGYIYIYISLSPTCLSLSIYLCLSHFFLILFTLYLSILLLSIYYVALVASGCVCISLSLVFNSRTRTKNPFGGPLKSAFGSTRIAWVMRKGLRYVLRAILLPLERTNGRPDHSERNCVSSVSLPSVDEKEKSLKSAIIYASRGRGIFIFLPYSFFSFLFFFLFRYITLRLFLSAKMIKKKKKGIESNREIDHPSRTNQPPFSRAIICMTRLSVFVANYLLRSCKSLLHSLLLYSYLLLSLFF